MLCSHCSVVFDRSTAKAFEASKIRMSLRKGYYDYQNTPRVNRNMLKTQKRKHQRMRRDTILAMQHKNVPRSLVFDRISEGPSPRFEKKFSIKDHEEKEMIMDSFKSSFEDS
ncbi:hypothetical protein GmHk_18G051986 [Glycine max]|nr:hypothetical protein GmHk_18G051986 [Glycine max]